MEELLNRLRAALGLGAEDDADAIVAAVERLAAEAPASARAAARALTPDELKIASATGMTPEQLARAKAAVEGAELQGGSKR